MILPSKELLISVLNLKKVDNIFNEDSLLYFCEMNKPINVYEFASKCKEWAYGKGLDMRTSTDGTVDLYSIDNDFEFSDSLSPGVSEVEAIFSVCETLLDSTDIQPKQEVKSYLYASSGYCPNCETEISSSSYWCDRLERDVDAWYCDNCDEYFLADEIQ